MPTCPRCGASVPQDAEVCAACGEVIEEQGQEQEQEKECPNCGNRIPADADVCPACGYLSTRVACATHPDRQAKGACVICGRPLCEECDHGPGAEYLCEEHSNIRVTEGWAQVYTTGDDMEADLVRDNLLAEGIDAQVLSQKDHFSFTMDLGDLARVRVLVPAFDYENAVRVLAGHEDITGQVEMACPACGAPYAAGDRSCGACGAALPEETEA